MVVHARDKHEQHHAYCHTGKLASKAVIGVGRRCRELDDKPVADKQQREKIERRVHVLEAAGTRSTSHRRILRAQ